jgi:hypothetical protein
MKTRSSIGKTLPMLYVDLVWSANAAVLGYACRFSGVSTYIEPRMRRFWTF